MIPAHMMSSLEGYKDLGWTPGSFLRSVLENNLVNAASNADEQNKHLLFEYARYLYNKLPRAAWGSPEAVDNWIKVGGELGYAETQPVNVVQLRD